MTPDIKRILVPLDFSANSTRALDYAHGLALKLDAAIHLIHVCEVPGMSIGSMDAYAIAYSDWSQRLGEEAECHLTEIKNRLRGVEATTEVLFGNPAAAIVDAANANDADLIVMGTHGHGALMHVMMGNVAERVVRAAVCPVLTVRGPTPARGREGSCPEARLCRRCIDCDLPSPARRGRGARRADEADDAGRRGLPHLLRDLPWHVGARRRAAGPVDEKEAREPDRDREA